MHYITSYVGAMLPYMLGALPLIILFRYFWMKKVRKNGGRTTLWREASMYHNFEPLIISLAGNIGIFIPMGIFLPWLWQKTLKQTVLISLLASLTIEICQIPQPRCSDIDDLWMNTLGGLIGWLICYVLPKSSYE